MAQVLDITSLLDSAQSPDAATRNAAEGQLKGLQESQFPSFVLSLAAELGSGDKPVSSRRLAGLVLKNALDAKEASRQAGLSERWMSLDAGVRSQVKQSLLATMHAEVIIRDWGDGVADARHTAGLVIAKVGAIEIPAGSWPELIPSLLAAAGTGTAAPGVRHAGLETLGYVCEELGALEEDYLEQGAVNQILTAVVGGMDKGTADAEVRLAATTALGNALEFARKNFESEGERSYIMQRVCEGTVAGDARLRHAAWECLVSIAGNYYETLPAYMADIFALSQRAIRGDEESVALQALEFWCSLCEEEAAAEEEGGVLHGFVAAALPQLAPLLLEQLTKQEEGEEGEEGAWNLAMAAGTCLGLCAGVVGDAIVPLVMPYVQANIQKNSTPEDWRAREAATFAFGSMLEGPSPETLGSLVSAGLPFLLAALKDAHPQVKNTTAWTIGRTLEFVHGTGAALIGPQNLPQIIQALLEAISDGPLVAEKVCYALSQLAAGFEGGAGTSPMSPYFQTVIQALLQTASRTTADAGETARLQTQAFEAINEVVRASAPDTVPLVAQLVPLMVARLQAASAHAAPSPEAVEKQGEEQALLCGVLQEAMLAMGALTYATGRGFGKYLEAFFPVLHRGLVQHQEVQVCQVSVGVLGDVCRAVEEGLAPYADRAMSAVLTNLGDGGVDRSLKPALLSALGDVALALGDGFEPYLGHVAAVLQGSMALSAQLAGAGAGGEEELGEYNNALRHGILEAWAGMLNGLSKAKADAHLRAAGPAILDLIAGIARDDAHRDVGVWKAALALLGDVAASLAGAGAALRDRPALAEFVEAAGQVPSLGETANWTSQVVSRALRLA
ncbi:Importin subunit beta-1 [Auxenochlorella protothecoides]|uniref:Importin subunit beta-1 n=1 Tax=Auxenochlorella protothecoides TaxID=3075 RepID=A0A087SP89_AUXPR|nr:Importin subunit beta-1 [Auxenochlorella protothecoides]KFM27543.1 Importin subunit beta-1 [Auxenochlorella protothecoides]